MFNISDAKQSLLERKEYLLNQIKYCEQRTENIRALCNQTNYVFQDDGDSDDDLGITVTKSPSLTSLHLDQTRLETCLQATQELANIAVMQSEITVLTEDPDLRGEPPVTEPGLWRDVTAECRIDLIPFTIMFYMHKASRDYGPISFRCLRVMPIKAAHENELAKSVLSELVRPSDAVELIRNYASAHRSRRTTLAKLVAKFEDNLTIDTMPEGGIQLKCGDVLELSWKLQNKSSWIMPFYHTMKFDLEYMEESYLKIIQTAHHQLADPSVETIERTNLLSKIIATCLEAKDQYHNNNTSTNKPKQLEKRRMTLDCQDNTPEVKRKKDSEMMAPPKTLPKKVKSKGKENIQNKDSAKPVKGVSNENVVTNAKKTKSDKLQNIVKVNEKQVASSNKKVMKSVANDKINAKLGENKIVSKNNAEKVINNGNSKKAVKEKSNTNKEGVYKNNVNKNTKNDDKPKIIAPMKNKETEKSKSNTKPITSMAGSSKVNVTDKTKNVATVKNKELEKQKTKLNANPGSSKATGSVTDKQKKLASVKNPGNIAGRSDNKEKSEKVKPIIEKDNRTKKITKIVTEKSNTHPSMTTNKITDFKKTKSDTNLKKSKLNTLKNNSDLRTIKTKIPVKINTGNAVLKNKISPGNTYKNSGLNKNSLKVPPNK